MYLVFKRFMDIVLSLLALPIVLVVILVFGIMIKLEDKGPIIYKSKRVGKKGEIFNMFKLRSMYINAPDIRLEDGATYNSESDSRVTRIGKFIRKTSIDELPQVVNVLIGNMSIIGPRPSTPYWLSICSEEEKEILTISPGLTGYNQAYFRNSISDAEKYRNDLIYVMNMSIIFDLKIFLKTIAVVLTRKGVNRNNEIYIKPRDNKF
ncbi:UDP-phosphate galactose phosphotransferase [Sporosarcina sp. P19]|nr:sugar transferase [Sporosarcina sp. P19]PIC77206.1 UDP-phosphate galactose phosphotransferase [Sporosarcina sp. P19]